jgi:hypothetical protein
MGLVACVGCGSVSAFVAADYELLLLRFWFMFLCLFVFCPCVCFSVFHKALLVCYLVLYVLPFLGVCSFAL